MTMSPTPDPHPSDLREQPPPLIEMAELVAHEINNLLNNVLLHVAVLERRKGLEAARAELAVIRQAGARAGELLNRWQQLTPRPDHPLQAVDLNRSAAAAVAAWQAEAGAHVPVRLELSSDLPAVLADPTDLARLVRLLLVNAAAAVEAGPITLRTEAAPAEVLLHVQDGGPGFDPALRERLFEPFVVARPLSPRAEAVPLHDLGLALCKRLARRQQGSIQAEDRPEGGVRVTIRLRPAGAN
jgi:two-component system nitrogen regulation sensor histidine kinase GlnL